MVQGRDERVAADPLREALSALVDGEADAAAAGDGVSHWRDDEDAKATWHAYQLIGDVLRSEDLAGGHRDRVFLQRMHSRLIQEPALLAPAPDLPQQVASVAHGGVLHRWAVPVGLAAGVALVLGTLLVVRQGPGADGSVLADAKPGLSLQPVELVAVASSSSSPVLLRDPRLDRYLAAHKQFQSANAMGPSTGFIRSATYDAATR
jgi:sigma-E factor negative regulatory protein RseA